MEATVFDNVRTACQKVAERATLVRINYDYISTYARTIPVRKAASPELDPNSHYLDHGEDTLAFILTLDTINFGSGYFPHLTKRPGMSGYFTVASSLNDYFKNHGPISANKLSQLTVDDCAKIFNQNLNNRPIRELMHHFTKGLTDLGSYLQETFNGSFVDLVESADASADRLVGILTQMPYFRDVASYGNLEVPFYKRAQLTAADLALAFNGSSPGKFDDLDNLTIFADNLVPHVLRVDTVLLYDKNLADRIDAGKLIRAESPDEVEIRACALHAVELLKKELGKAGYHTRLFIVESRTTAIL
jgi:hypothetical protein